MKSLTWIIGGAQGSGVDSAANIFARACAQAGFSIFGKREYHSNIKGEHSYFTVRVSDAHIRSHVDKIDVLVCSDADTVFRHGGVIAKDGAIIYDQDSAETSISDVSTLDEDAANRVSRMLEEAGRPPTVRGMLDYVREYKEVLVCDVPYFKLIEDFAKSVNEPALSKLSRMTNVMAVSASMSILGIDMEVLKRAIRYVFATKPKVADLNIAAANYSYDYARQKFDSSRFISRLPVQTKSSSTPPSSSSSRDSILVQGVYSCALGKMVAGCKFQTYYPITPASDESEFLEANEIVEDQKDENKNSSYMVVVQTEDEISAICMAIGAALAGVRSSTATSGPGFSLMAEAMGWAGMNEVPVVITLYQRAGPSTGLPTRHEQGDLQFAIHAGHGEFPRIVLASGDIEEVFYDAIKVFNYAEKYQVPVIHILDKAIANSITTCKVFDLMSLTIERGNLLKEIMIPPPPPTNTAAFIGSGNNQGHVEEKTVQGNKISFSTTTKESPEQYNFKRFRVGASPISPRVPLGTPNAVFWNSGDEHNEEGHITEDPLNRIKMVDKRMGKLALILKEIPDEDKAVAYSNRISGNDHNNNDQDKKASTKTITTTPTAATITIVSWGSTKGAILDALDQLDTSYKEKVMFVQIRLLHPFPTELVRRMLTNTKVLIDIEMNWTCQLGMLIEQNLHREIDYQIIKYNGRPMSSSEIYDALKSIIVEENATSKRIVLTQGA